MSLLFRRHALPALRSLGLVLLLGGVRRSA